VPKARRFFENWRASLKWQRLKKRRAGVVVGSPMQILISVIHHRSLRKHEDADNELFFRAELTCH
jgi:hypothetical protein